MSHKHDYGVRMNNDNSAFGQGFDTPYLHHKKLFPLTGREFLLWYNKLTAKCEQKGKDAQHVLVHPPLSGFYIPIA